MIGEYFDWKRLIQVCDVKNKTQGQFFGIMVTLNNVVKSGHIPQTIHFHNPKFHGFVICPKTLNYRIIEMIKDDPLGWEKKFETFDQTLKMETKIENIIENVKAGKWSLSKLEEKLNTELHRHIDSVVIGKVNK